MRVSIQNLIQFVCLIVIGVIGFSFFARSTQGYCDPTVWHDYSTCSGTAPNCSKVQYNDCDPGNTRTIECTGGSCNYGTTPTPTPGGTTVWAYCGVCDCNGSTKKCSPDCLSGSTCYCERPCIGDGCCTIDNDCQDNQCSNCNTTCRGYCESNNSCGSGNACIYRCDPTPIPPSGSTPTPTIPIGCGDGFQDPTEQCDYGSNNSDTVANACRLHCTWPICGDYVTDGANATHGGVDEECDDGANGSVADSCSPQCFSTPQYALECTSPTTDPYAYDGIDFDYSYTGTSNAYYFNQFVPSLTLTRYASNFSIGGAIPATNFNQTYPSCSGYFCTAPNTTTLPGSSLNVSNVSGHNLLLGVNMWATIDGVADIACAWDGVWSPGAPNTRSTYSCANSCAVTKPILNPVIISCNNLTTSATNIVVGDTVTVTGATLSSNIPIINTVLQYHKQAAGGNWSAWSNVSAGSCTGNLNTGSFSCTFDPGLIAGDLAVEVQMKPHANILAWNLENGPSGRTANGGTATGNEEMVCAVGNWQGSYAPNNHPSTACTNTCLTTIPVATSTPTPTATATPTVTSTPTVTPTGTLLPTATPTITPTPTATPTVTPTPTITPIPTPTSTPTVTPTPTAAATPTPTSTPTPTPTTPPNVAVAYGYVTLDSGSPRDCNTIPISGGQSTEPGLCYARVIRQSPVGGPPSGYDNGFGFDCFTEETGGNWYWWGHDPEPSVSARHCQFSGSRLQVRDDNNALYPNVYYDCVTDLNQTNYPSLYNGSGDFVGGQLSCTGPVANNIMNGKNFRIYPKYISYTCGGGYYRSGYDRLRNFPANLNSYSDGISLTTPSSGNPFPGNFLSSRSNGGVTEVLRVDNDFSNASIDATTLLPASRTASYALNNTTGPYNFCFAPLSASATSTPTPTLTPTPTDTPTPTPTDTPTPTPTSIEPWWQAQGGNIFANDNLMSTLPATTSYLVDAIPGQPIASAGIPMCFSGPIDLGINPGNDTSANPTVKEGIGTTNSICTDYSYDVIQTKFDTAGATDHSGISAVHTLNDVASVADDRGDYQLFYTSGDLTFSITTPWDISTSGEKIIVVVDGNLTIAQAGGVESLINLANDAFLGVFVQGDITIEPTVGHDISAEPPIIEASNLMGLFFSTNGKIITQGLTPPAVDKRFVGDGTFIGCEGITLGRDLHNGTNKAEIFRYNPNLLFNVPTVLEDSHITWQDQL